MNNFAKQNTNKYLYLNNKNLRLWRWIFINEVQRILIENGILILGFAREESPFAAKKVGLKLATMKGFSDYFKENGFAVEIMHYPFGAHYIVCKKITKEM